MSIVLEYQNMEEKSAKNSKIRKNPHELTLLELEEMVRSFRSAHGEKKLMSYLRNIIPAGHETARRTPKTERRGEPTIAELEKIFRVFEGDHGHRKLFDSIAEAIGKKTNKPEIPATKPAPDKHVVYKNKKSKAGLNLFLQKAKDKLPDKIDFPKILQRLGADWHKKKYRYPLVATGLFFGIYFLFNLPLYYTQWSWKPNNNIPKTLVKTQEVVQKKSADTAALAPGEVIPADNRLVIPKLNVNVPIVMADTTDENKVHDELHDGVVHYQGTAIPGEVGNSFITGHSSNYWWDTGKYNYVFALLDKLQAGDQAIIYYNGKKFVYTVRDSIIVPPNDMSVLAPTDTPVLSLMTCTPAGTSLRRLVVHFDRTDPVYYKPQVVTKEQVIDTPKETTTTKDSSLFDSLTGLLPN